MSSFARQRAFSVAIPLVWNSLPDYLRDPAVGRDFRKASKDVFVGGVPINIAHWRFYDDALYKYEAVQNI